MTERERIGHLLRRYGLGAGEVELNLYMPLGLEGALDRLLNFEAADEAFDVSPWSMARGDDGQIQLDPSPFAAWWALRMVMTQRPLQERMTLFWHDHFAVSGEKLFDGPAMLGYLNGLREAALGPFPQTLAAGVKNAAMLYYLDAQQNYPDAPNENLGRELLELFTVGEGHFTEKDVREASRALTGWMVHFAGIGDDREFELQRQEAAQKGRSMFAFCEAPSYHDTGFKTVLGKTAKFDGDALLNHLAAHPLTAQRICLRLFDFFVGTEPSAARLKVLTDTWEASGGDLRPVLRAIAESDEFWLPANTRSMAKSPVDFSIAMLRQIGVGDILRPLMAGGSPDRPANEILRAIGTVGFFLMAQQGLTLFYPPNVGGWEWGEGWITSSNTLERLKHPDLLLVGDDPSRPIAAFLAQQIVAQGKASPAGMVEFLASRFDAELSEADRAALVAEAGRLGGASALATPEAASQILSRLLKAVIASPKFQQI